MATGGGAPGGEARLGFVGGDGRLVGRGGHPGADGLGRRRHGTRCEACERGDAERGRVRRRVHLDRCLQQVGLGLHQQPRAGEPAVDAQPGQRRAEVVAGRACQPGDLCRDPVDDGAHERGT